MTHQTELVSSGTIYGWRCSCGNESRHLLPLPLANRYAVAHEREENKR